MDLFKPGAPWSKAVASIQIFKVSQRFLDGSTDDQLKAVIDDLRHRHIALGMSAQIIVTTRQCGQWPPRLSIEASIQLAADRVTSLGGRLQLQPDGSGAEHLPTDSDSQYTSILLSLAV